MDRKKLVESLVVGLIALVGAATGSWISAGIQSSIEAKKREISAASDAWKFNSGEPQNISDIRMLFDQQKTLMTLGSGAVKAIAALNRKYPNCTSGRPIFSEECEIYHVEHVAIMRNEVGVGKVPNEDLAVILKPFNVRARNALKTFDSVR